MLAETLTALAAAAATVLVESAATDAWAALKNRLAKLVGRNDPAATTEAEAALERTRANLERLEDAELADTKAEEADQWARRLRTVLERDPEAAAELRAWLAAARQSGHGSVTITAIARDNASQIIQGTGVQNITVEKKWPG
ncbi:hypothetical protein GCM10009555_078630 [Acrocarpospora macrocephala]|uniref:Uncharacterized protein n=1 Tax=Acrocarpospora macrocephala TaxID=150177 RepID=A0A5M3X532_9ACTN|nr:DUF4034 domain-containing protein [Acrocarpospora macrocephala]GES16264.1 hypothetical protein Amac_098620 [Acrocarpospora macrocephala]